MKKLQSWEGREGSISIFFFNHVRLWLNESTGEALVDSFNHNRITRLKTRYKEILLLVYNRYSHYIWWYHIPETNPRDKLAQIPHIRDSKFCTTRITLLAWQVKCDKQACEKHRNKLCQCLRLWWQRENNFWNYNNKKLRQVKVHKVYLMVWNDNHVVFLPRDPPCVVCPSCFESTKYTCLKCMNQFYMRCSVFENDEDVAGWKAGNSVAYCESCFEDKMIKAFFYPP